MVESCLLLCHSFPKDPDLVLQARGKVQGKRNQLLSIQGLEEQSLFSTNIIRTKTTLETLTSISNPQVILEVVEVLGYQRSIIAPRKAHQTFQIHSMVFTTVLTPKIAHGNHQAPAITMKITQAGQMCATGAPSLLSLNNRGDHHSHGGIYRCLLRLKVRCRTITNPGSKLCQIMSLAEVPDGVVVAHLSQRSLGLMEVQTVNSCSVCILQAMDPIVN